MISKLHIFSEEFGIRQFQNIMNNGNRKYIDFVFNGVHQTPKDKLKMIKPKNIMQCGRDLLRANDDWKAIPLIT